MAEDAALLRQAIDWSDNSVERGATILFCRFATVAFALRVPVRRSCVHTRIAVQMPLVMYTGRFCLIYVVYICLQCDFASSGANFISL